MPELISQEERKARKEHTCNYCGEKIEKGVCPLESEEK